MSYFGVDASLAKLAVIFERGSSGPIAAPATTIVVPNLACDTKGGFSIGVEFDAATTEHNQFWMQINGLETNFKRLIQVAQIGNGILNLTNDEIQGNAVGADPNYAHGRVGRVAAFTFDCPHPHSSNPLRRIYLNGWFLFDGAPENWQTIFGALDWFGAGEITSFGIRGIVANGFAATTRVSLRSI